ncbi:GNAT family N-acetyltransferase [Cryptosporangium sp. NPDC048952]|uniref:GNAT family N-acetyltransferase n=1 Tax=Cryptosporangium sp. NPDC048952 TaxID=3363961 RepID=UPI0037112D6F
MPLPTRAATPADLPKVIELVTQMFDDLGATGTGWEDSARERLVSGTDIATFVAVDSGDTPVAAAVGVVDQRLPSPRRPDGRIGYVEWLATDPEQRRRGAARGALTALLDWFDDQGISAVDVHSSEDALGLYEQLGFGTPPAVPMRRLT